MKFEYTPPLDVAAGVHHHSAAAGNVAVAKAATAVLGDSVNGDSPHDVILLKAAAGAGKSFALRQMVEAMVANPNVQRVAVTAFTNNQVEALVRSLTAVLGRERVGWFVSRKRMDDLDPAIVTEFNVHTRVTDFGDDVSVFVGTAHKLGTMGEKRRLLDAFDEAEFPFDVLFVDEGWQLPEHLFAPIAKHAAVVVGVGDVGQLPPLEIGKNPWRGDERYNPYRAWPHSRDSLDGTWSAELPAVWRPAGEQLAVWRAFYPDWHELNSVAAPGDRRVEFEPPGGGLGELLGLVATGVPTVLEVDGLPEPEAADVDLPLTHFAEQIVDALVAGEAQLLAEVYAPDGSSTGEVHVRGGRDIDGDAFIALLATRNQAVDDAADAVDRIRVKHHLPDGSVVASTVDSWQGQTNGITVAIHPLSAAEQLDEFNSAFGRLAVTCTRATHALLVLTRPGLDELLNSVPARPGTPFGEPGDRQLPRQTHQRILRAFARATVTIDPNELEEP